MIKVLRKLKGRSRTELRVRGIQAAASLLERAGLSSDARVPETAAFFRLLDPAQFDAGAPFKTDALVARFRNAPSHPFFTAFNEAQETRATLERRFGGRARAQLLERAERIVAGRFDLLGFKALDFGKPVDWHLEPVSQKRTPLAHWSRIDYLDPAAAGDKKITWELNRQQYFMVLGRAYWRTGDERYAATFARHLEAWMEGNPPKRGINWASSLEVAFRAISWLWALQFFKHSTHLTPALYARALKFLYLHARHLETNLSTYFSPNTHLTGEALGLVYLGTLLPEFRAARRWRTTGARILFQELERQIRPDGVYFEQTSYYHRYTTDFYLHFLALLRADKDDATRVREESGARSREELRADVLEEKLQLLLDHLMYLTLPSGTTPLFGDEDGGRLAWFDERPHDDFRSTLATGAALLRRGDYKYVARETTEETLWLASARALADFDALDADVPAQESRAFREGGYYVMRDGWTAESNYLLLDCGPHGSLNGAHAHADALAILALAARGRHLLVDSGTYTYTGSSALRDRFRSTAAHNTLVVDGESSSVAAGAFRWRTQARARCRRWLSHTRFDLFEGEHDGYLRLLAPAQHARTVLFVKGDYWIVRDRVETTAAHRYELNFHFNARADASIETADGAQTISASTADAATSLDLLAFARGGAWRKEEALHSARYGAATKAPVCTFEFASDAHEAFTLLVPHGRTGAAQIRAREIEAVGGRAFELKGEGARRDLLLVRDASDSANAVEAACVASDFSWTWLRFQGDDTEPRELIAIGGRHLRLDGREILRAHGARLEYVVARRAGDNLIVETDAHGVRAEDLFISLSALRRDEARKGIEQTVTSDK
ncbi:MAG TPA: alginate lyase family protein [Pyrinomonadaceae bacterium]|nr:alginate lyase family protein [Pyrinomonadaceae bacterium]